jgi:chromosome segregation ATPase
MCHIGHSSYHSFNGVRFDDEDISNSLTSDVDLPGTRPNLTSSGRLSPHRIRSLRDQETQLQELKKENFGLKLRIYHLEEQLRKRHGDLNEDWEMIIQLNVQVDELKQEKTDIELLVKDAKNAIDTYEAKIKELERELAEVIKISEEVPQLKETIKHLRKEHQEYEILARESQEEAVRGVAFQYFIPN